MLSFWEKKHLLHYDLVVVGAGIVGLSTAIQYKRKRPGSGVLVLEQGIFPSGASTKNAGFACFGSLTEILDDLDTMSEKEVLELVSKRFEGLNAIRREFGDKALGYEATGGFELFTEKEIPQLGQMAAINKLLFPLFDAEVFQEMPSIDKFGFGKNVQAVVRNSFEGELDTGKFIAALWERCQALGVRILTGVKVDAVDIGQGIVSVSSRTDNQSISFSAVQVAFCTNAFTRQLLPDLDIVPGRGLVMVTKPLSGGIPWTGTFHYDKGYVYFRQVDGRLLIGGGRNLDFEGERTTESAINPKIRAYLINLVSEVIFPGKSWEFDMEWTGVMAFGETKKPIVKRLNQNVGVAVRLGGMGVAIGWQTAGELVELLDQS
jgi:glycine/D-amino acid oxidase-like deaminating enzyme